MHRDGSDAGCPAGQAKGVTSETLGTGTFALTWNGFIGVWTVSAVTAGAPLFALFSLPFWVAGATLATEAVLPVIQETVLEIGVSKFELRETMGVFGDGKEVAGYTTDLDGVNMVTEMVVNGTPLKNLQLVEGALKHSFGGGLSEIELQWVQTEIRAFLEAVPQLDA
ncbi:hypothetical protein CYMTET_18456 [Cymbomonas tetramitiformis]|uniref:Uncharacterized protein n=1 Tax=Cymbomonas tetramitiformis TaxID=36881 RepID=A0AAE0G8M2_9CHLO|nr:hypothetical protein CYMTET_18456 [Cymbomonas tetramitiformis]